MKTSRATKKRARNAPSPSELFGTTPALSSEKGKAGPPDSRDVSLRWLAGTILTGVTSITLMGGALTAALEGQDAFVVPSLEAQQPANLYSLASADADTTVYSEKGDRPLPVKIEKQEKEILRLSTLTRVEGGKERVRTRPFARVSAKLAKRVDDPSFDIPKFDPVTIFSSDEKFREKGDEDILYGAQVDDEIAMQHLPMPLEASDFSHDRTFSDDEIEANLRQRLPILKASLGDGSILAYAGAIPYVDPARFEPEQTIQTARITTNEDGVIIKHENVSTFAKTNRYMNVAEISREEVIDIDSEQPVTEVVSADPALRKTADTLVSAFREHAGKTTFTDRHELRLAYAGNVGDERPDIISLFEEGSHVLTMARTDTGHYVEMDKPSGDLFTEETAEPEYAPLSDTYRAIYETALKKEIPAPLIRDLVRIYAFDVDFRRQITATDEMEVFYSLDPESEIATEDSEILYTSITLGDTKRRYYRFKTSDDGEVDYYDEDGRSAKKFLMRQPVPRARFRSGFGWRKHPILGKTRLHRGVDWSAPRGTPIFAAGNGVIEEARWFAGYGRWVKIRHTNGYKTGYAHMSRFAKGIKPGTRVRQGQVIGYVGSTGLSTGPHLHYEVIVNGRHVNPMRIRLPRGRVLSGDQLAAFETERDRINRLLDGSGEQQNQRIALNSRQ
ncbi:MAG: M23 family metallopeptidase [Pseudomonadota bacterium]